MNLDPRSLMDEAERRLRSAVQALTSPHARAEALTDAWLDTHGEGSGLAALGSSPDLDDRWLAAHLDGCLRCQARFEQRRRLLERLRTAEELRAPEGFAERVQRAARASKAHLASPARAVGPGRREPNGPAGGLGNVPAWVSRLGSKGPARWALGAALAIAAGAFVAGPVLPGVGGRSSEGEVQVGAAGLVEAEMSNFVVRAPGLGAARLRRVVTALVEGQGGSFAVVEGGLRVVLPRSALLPILAELERQVGLEVNLLRELSPEADEVVLRFEL